MVYEPSSVFIVQVFVTSYRLTTVRILWKIFGPCKLKMGLEGYEQIMNWCWHSRVIKSRTLVWLGHVRRTDDGRTTKRITDWKPVDRRIRERPRKRLIDDIVVELTSMNVRAGEFVWWEDGMEENHWPS